MGHLRGDDLKRFADHITGSRAVMLAACADKLQYEFRSPWKPLSGQSSAGQTTA